MTISPFTPLFFIDRKTDGLPSDYTQTFATTDNVLIEVFCRSGEVVSGSVVNTANNARLYDISWSSWEVNGDTMLLFATLSFGPGRYYVSINGRNSEPFVVTDNAKELEKTTLLQYSMDSNRHRQDVVFFIDGMQYFFDFRVPGGFKDSNWTFGVETENFVADDSDIISLYAREFMQQKFTLGSSRGCPVWFADLLNRLLCCKYVYFDGVRYARKDASVPEATTVLEGVNSFVFNQTLQRVTNMNPSIELQNQLIMRRITSADSALNDKYRSIDNNTNLIL